MNKIPYPMASYNDKSRSCNSRYSSNIFSSDRSNECASRNSGGLLSNFNKSNSTLSQSSKSSSQSSFECRVCLNTYSTRKDLQNHLHAAQHLRPLSRGSIDTVEESSYLTKAKRKEQNGFTCKVCFTEFASHKEMKAHINEVGHHFSAKRHKILDEDELDSCEEIGTASSPCQRSDNPHFRTSDVRKNSTSRITDNPRKSLSPLQSLTSSTLDASSVAHLNNKTIVGSSVTSNGKGSKKTVVPVTTLFQWAESNQSITSPENSRIKVPNGMSSTSESQKSAALIPIEPHVSVTDPRKRFETEPINTQNDKHTRHRTHSSRQSPKWAPVYYDRTKSTVADKLIPWKLIPIDFEPSNYSKIVQSNTNFLSRVPSLVQSNTDSSSRVPSVVQSNTDSSSRVPSVVQSNTNPLTRAPSPVDDTLGASIDELAAQLKEDTGATFIPGSRASVAARNLRISFEGSISSREDNGEAHSRTSSFCVSEEQLSVSSTPYHEENTNEEQRSTNESSGAYSCNVPQDCPSIIRSVSEISPTLPCSAQTSCTEIIDVATTSKVPSVHEEDIAICHTVSSPECPSELVEKKENLGQTKPILTKFDVANDTSATSPSTSFVLNQTLSSKIHSKNIEKINTRDDSPLSPLSSDSQINVEKLSSSVTPHTDFVESRSRETCSKNNVGESLVCPVSSCNPLVETVIIQKPVEICEKCQAGLDTTFLKIDLKTGNLTVDCQECGVRIIMLGAYKKIR